MDDPWDWNVDRIVQEFCTPNRSWKPNKEPPALPALDQLEASLRDQETDGFTLLTYSDHADLYQALGIKKLNQKATFNNAIDQFRKCSLKYQQHQSGQEVPLQVQDIPEPQAHPGSLDPNTKKKRLLDELRLFKSLHNISEKAGVEETITPDKTPNPTPSPVPALVIEPTLNPPRIDGPAPKKRRIAPITITTDVDVHAIRNIPTAADEILGGLSDAAPTSMPIIDPSEAYLGMDAVTRIEISELDSPVTDSPLTSEDQGLNIFHGSPVPRGRQLQMHRLFKRRLLPRRTPDRLIPTKPDTVFGTNDPNRDEVLPLFGESDSEYDSETWEEMQAESSERAKGGTASAGLNADLVNAIIADEIQKLVEEWRERRLPKLSRRAYKVWSEPRRRGYLRVAIENERQRIQDLETRITKYHEKILEQQFYKEADVQSMCRIFEQTIEEKETASWKIGILSSSDEPEKPTYVPRTSVKKRPHKTHRVGDDGSEILTSESDEDGLNDFIVDDEIPLVDDAPGSPMDLSDQNSPRPGIGLVNRSQNGTIDKQRAEGGIDPAQSNSAHVPGLLDDPRTPSKSQRPPPPIIDLTITPDKQPMSNGDSATMRDPSNSAIRIKLPKSETRSRQSSSKRHERRGPSALVMDIGDLSAAEQETAMQLQELGRKFLSTIFTVALEMKPELIWNDFVRPALEAPVYPQSSYSPEELDIIVAFRILRLFDVWSGEVHSFGYYKRLSDADKQKLIEDGNRRQEDFVRFIGFINRIADRFEWDKANILKKDERGSNSASAAGNHQATGEIISDSDNLGPPGDDTNSEAADGSSSKKKKRRARIIRNKEAQNLRAGDRARIAEQEARRSHLRRRFEQLEASGEVMGSQRAMIINESKEEGQGFIYVHREIASRIKDHQVSGVRFMWDQVVAKSGTRSGCLLAHTMGLGKTMQIITLLVAIAQAAASDDESIRSQIPDDLLESKTLIICPPSIVNNWLDELLLWSPEDHGLGPFRKIDSQTLFHERKPIVESWAEDGGVLVIGYHLLKQCMEVEGLEEILVDTPNLIVADEAHYMKNPKSKTHIATSSFRTRSRIALTGSPLANNVEEYHAMINWVAPNYLSDLREFRSEYANPIRDGLGVDSDARQRRRALSILHALKTTVGPKVHRLTIATLKNDIPPKTEFVVTVPLTTVQRFAYESYVRSQERTTVEQTSTSKIFASINILGLLCAHPNCFLKFLVQKSVNKSKQKEGEEFDVTLPPNLVSGQISFLRKTKDIDWLFHSWKIPMVTAILDESRKLKDAVLVFSQSISTLDYLENILRMQKRTVQRLDGSTAINSRQAMVKDFNKHGTDVFLISTTAGGVGLNITGANRVIIFDFKFNPQQEMQAIGRAYRLGQTKPVFVYRFICGGTFEETLLSRAIFKMQLADRVVDKKNPIPKASSFGELFKMPSDPEQKDLSEHRGRDVIMDKILDSEELRPGVRSIILMDTFQEESLEDSKLSPDESIAAAQLVAQLEARRTGKPYQDPSVIQQFDTGATTSQPIPNMKGAIIGQVQEAGTVPSVTQAPPDNGAIPSQYPMATPNILAQVINEDIDRSNLGQHLKPTMGASTSIRNPRSDDSALQEMKAFRDKLICLFRKHITGPDFTKVDQISQAVVDAVEGQESQTSFEDLYNTKLALLQAANFQRFFEAVERGILLPEQLAKIGGAKIEEKRGHLEDFSNEEWEDYISQYPRKADPEVAPPSHITPNSNPNPNPNPPHDI